MKDLGHDYFFFFVAGFRDLGPDGVSLIPSRDFRAGSEWVLIICPEKSPLPLARVEDDRVVLPLRGVARLAFENSASPTLPRTYFLP